MKNKIIVNIASQPKRTNGLVRRIKEFLPQCDKINVCIEDSDTINEELWKLEKNDKVNFHFTHKNLGSNGKFFCVADSNGFYITVDEDICFPVDYVEKIISEVETHERKKIVSYHGAKFMYPINNYYFDRFCFDYRFQILHDELCDTLGTGVCAFHSDVINLSLQDFPNRNMSDLQLAIAAKKQGVEMIALKHNNGFLLPDQEYKDKREGIYFESKNNCEIQTDLANQHWKP